MAEDIHERLENADWLHLADGEEIRWEGRPSRYTIVGSVGFGLVLVVAGVALSGMAFSVAEGSALPNLVGVLPLVLSLYGVIHGVKTYVRWYRHRYVITDQGVYVKYGLISRDVTAVPIERVQNSSFDQSLLQRLLSFGDVHVFTAGSSTEDLTLEGVPSPESVSEALLTTQSRRFREDREPAGAV